MKIKAIIEKNWTNETIDEVVNNPRCLDKYDDVSDRLELATLAYVRNQKQDYSHPTDKSERIIAAEDIGGGIESYFYACMVDDYIENYVAELHAFSAEN